MKLLKYILPIFAALSLSACGGDDDEPKLIVDFTVSCDQTYSTGLEVDAVSEKGGCKLTAMGWEYEYVFDINGVYDYFLLAEGCPDWITVSTTATQIKVKLPTHYSETARTGTFNFVVFKGNASSSGHINIIQEPITSEELEDHEQFYMALALAKVKVVETLPSDGKFSVGDNAPFYKLTEDGSVYMQVLSMGTEGVAKAGDQVYFRFTRYRLFDWTDGNLSNREGNMNDMFGTATFFVLGSNNTSSTQWGSAIPMPIKLGLPYGSVVNLIVRSDAGFEAEKSYYQPYFYTVRYFKPAV